MKKILVVILLFTYSFAASGATVELHYCMGKLIGWDFEYTSKNDCRNCNIKTKPAKGCCDNKQLQAKVDKDQQAAYNNILFTNNHFAIVPSYTIIEDGVINGITIVHPSIHAPPLISETPAYLLNCNFRI